jgi:hypothetical protein
MEMTSESFGSPPFRWWSAALLALLIASAGCATGAAGSAAQTTPSAVQPDPRVGLRAGWDDPGVAAHNLELLAQRPRPQGFFNPARPGDGDYANTDLAFQGDFAFVGNYHGFNIYDISDPRNPRLRTSVVCPGGQGDVSVHGDLLFMSVEQTRARIDCGAQGAPGLVNRERFRGVRIFDIGNLDAPIQIAAVQTCRGSHTHSLMTDAADPENLFVYVSGTGPVRPEAELPGCFDIRSAQDPNTSYFSIAVIQVPLSAPQEARVIGEPRVFANTVTGAIAGLWPGGDHGPGTQSTAQTNQCHDITTYPELGLAAGACAGNGLLFDLSDPANPVRTTHVTDPNFAYWHSATFNNDGTKVIFTDEWGGGSAPRCRATDPPAWGANAIFTVVDGRLEFGSYFKLPAPQTATENCVAHNGSLVPVPGRDIKVQAWYQGGISVFDFTDAANPVEIAFFDRGPLSATELILGGHWSAYWYNGYIYGSEIARGFDVLRLTPSEHLTRNELDAANLVRYETFNPQHQPRIVWPASFVVARAYLDQLERGGRWSGDRISQLRAGLERAERLTDATQKRESLTALATGVDADRQAATGPRAVDAARLTALRDLLRELANTPG